MIVAKTERYITCKDCNIDWINQCGVCKQSAWRIRKKKIVKLIYPMPFVTPKRSHYCEQEERKFWNKYHPKRVVTLIIKGHDAACTCCYTLENLTFDHIIPLSKGGVNSWKNGQILCAFCNEIKDDKIISIRDLQELFGLKSNLLNY